MNTKEMGEEPFLPKDGIMALPQLFNFKVYDEKYHFITLIKQLLLIKPHVLLMDYSTLNIYPGGNTAKVFNKL